MIYVSAAEKTSPLLTGTLVDGGGTAISPSDVSSVKFTCYDQTTAAQAIINSRSAQEVLDGAVGSTDEFTIDVNGVFEFVFTAADMVFLSTTADWERHYFEFDVTYVDSAGRTRNSVIDGVMTVTNRRKVS